mgnify:CR=1 FL=1
MREDEKLKFRTRPFAFALCLGSLAPGALPAPAQLDGNADEARVGTIALPPVLTLANGRPAPGDVR